MKFTRPITAAVTAACLLVVVACGNDDGTSNEVGESTPSSIEVEANASFTVNPGTHMITITDAQPGTELVVSTTEGTQVASGTVDEQGSLLFRRIEAGTYRLATADGGEVSEAVDVYGPDAVPSQDFYSSQVLPAGGFGYLTTRDGTTLSINVSLPGPIEDGPYPTVVEYSGYAPSNPGDSSLSLLYNALGFAYVGVNMRGTGCSGGSYRFFEEAQLLDGYDAIEAIAAQP
ncbi:MAG: hypothetical protein RL391_1770, partial [Actinomycetota bacterium]